MMRMGRHRTSTVAIASAVLIFLGTGLAIAADEDPPTAQPPHACPLAGDVLAGVYHPGRLEVLNPCTRADGRIVLVKPEADGDLHLLVNLDPSYTRLLDSGNATKLHDDLVVELMPRDAGHVSAPQVGQSVSVLGAWSHDRWHDWNEIHPVWSVATDGGAPQVTGPQYGGAPAGASPYAAAADCRRPSGEGCVGYGQTN
jgi:hypothetical protein